jgi:carbon-monoxide dehydrogenase medium subunit
MKPFEYLEPKDSAEACALLSRYKEEAKIIAGGTDLLTTMRRRVIRPRYIIDLKAIPGLDYIRRDGEILKIGALTTIHDIEISQIICAQFPVLAEAARKMATLAIRNMGTIGGNLCNAAPSADMAPPLIGLGARAKIEGPQGERSVALEDFFAGPGMTVLQDGEMLAEILVPDQPAHTYGVYKKFTPRTAIDIALVGVAVVITLDSKHIRVVDARIVLGAVAPTPVRAQQDPSLTFVVQPITEDK